MVHVLYNPLAGNGTGWRSAQCLAAKFVNEPISYQDMVKVKDVYSFLAATEKADRVIIAGGDGTLNRFINGLNGQTPPCNVYYYPTGSGNDFFKDQEDRAENDLICLNPYIENLPTVTVCGETRHFLNGIGYGIDGYCCEEGDRLRETTNKPINYTAIAIKGLLYRFKPVNARVTVDGRTSEYKKVWLAPTMNGRFYGGGVMVAPGQDRLDPEHKLSLIVVHGSGKLKPLIMFPSIFKGRHVRHKGLVEVICGRDITVEFDRSTALQIDGDTVKDVTGYHCQAAKAAVRA